MANITTTLVNDSIATMIAAEALGYLQANTVLAFLVNQDYSNEVATHGQSVKIPFTGALSVNDKAADTDITLQAPADTAVTVTLDKHKEVSFVIEDIAEAFSRPNYLQAYASDAMSVIAEQIDTDIAALYATFSQSIDATAGLAEDDFREAARLLDSARAPQVGRYMVLHEDAAYETRGIDRVINSDYRQSLGALAAANFLGDFMGFRLFMNQNIPFSTDLKNLAFHRNAIVMATRPMPLSTSPNVAQTIASEGGFSVRVTRSYDHDKLGEKFTLDVLYGVAELRDNHGVVVRTAQI